jgi:hypothetical protein
MLLRARWRRFCWRVCSVTRDIDGCGSTYFDVMMIRTLTICQMLARNKNPANGDDCCGGANIDDSSANLCASVRRPLTLLHCAAARMVRGAPADGTVRYGS